MKLIYAHYPSLVRAFTRRMRQLEPGPSARVLAVCPSARVSKQLSRRLAQELGAVSGVYFQTFNSLLYALDAEDGAVRPPLLPGDNLQNFILKNVLARPGLDMYVPGRGFVSALKGSLRDLADSLADPDVLEEHLRTASDSRLTQESEHLTWFHKVYRAYMDEMDRVPGYRSYRAWFEHAESQIAHSAWLGGFKEIIFYGFYDMTGRQLEIFNGIKAHYPVTVLAPYVKHPAYQFARKFFETNLLGGENEEIALDADASALGPTASSLFGADASPAPRLTLASAAGARGELDYAAKEMLKLADAGTDFADMAVIVRSVEPYKNDLEHVFEENKIPWQGTLPFTLKQLPLGVFCLNLFNLLANSFDRDSVLAVVGSPYFKIQNKWRYLINASLVSRDYAQWTDLITPQTKYYDEAFLPWLEGVKTALENLNKARAWDDLAESALQFLQNNLNEDALRTDRDKTAYREIKNAVNGLKRYGAVRKNAQEGEFGPELADALSNVPLNIVSDAQAGVTVVDAINARGLSFKAVFVLGMNEKNFPQVIKEDPIFKDYYRYVLRDGLGFWVNQKLERFEEEKLLFFNAVTAASDRLFVSYQRVNAEGKPAVPSVYLAELARAAQTDLQSPAAVRVSARLSERAAALPVGLLSPRELSGVLALGADAEEKLDEAGLLTPFAARSLRACQKLRRFAGLNEYDGVIASGAEVFTKVNGYGFSPSALQDLGHCPLKYFFSKAVDLREPDENLSRHELAPNLRGTAQHQILMDFYRDLYEKGLAGQLFDSALADKLQQAADKNYTKDSYKTFGIYPVIWDIILQDIKDSLTDFVQKDAEYLDGFVPSVFETFFEAEYAPADGLKMRLKGIIDRIDVNEKDKTFRVVDYKSGRKGSKDLRTDILKHLILQPFIYLILAGRTGEAKGLRPAGACLLSINKGYYKQELPQDGFDEIKPKADAFLKRLAELVREGKFFLNLSEQCQYCPYAAICRKDSFKSLMRARHAPEYHALEDAKK